MLTLTSPVRTPLHALPAGIKLVALLVLTSLVFWLEHPLVLAGFLAGIAVLYLQGGWSLLRHGLQLLWPLWPFVAMIVGWHLWRGTPALGGLILLRMTIAVMAANLVTMTSRLDDMIAVITRVAAPLALIGLPPRRFALAVALAIRFIPDLLESARRLALAWRARSARRPYHRLLVPLSLSAIDTAEHVADALRARGGAG